MSDENKRISQRIILAFCGATFIFCSLVPIILLGSWAFSSEHMLQWIVSFDMIASWASRPEFSISKLVGICYNISRWLPIILVPIGIVLSIRPKVFVNQKKVFCAVTIVVFSLISLFYLFAAIVNIIRLDNSAYYSFYFYMFSELILCAAASTICIITVRKITCKPNTST